MSRTGRFLWVLLGLVVAAASGWIGGRTILSPEQIAADRSPPEPSPIAVPVLLTRISNDIVTRGTLRFENPRPVVAPTVTGVDPVVTLVPSVDDLVQEGDVLYEIAGRPVFVMEGVIPLYRTAGNRDSGDDIAQVQEALVRMGYLEADADGVYGPSTERAVVEFYEAKGYEAAARDGTGFRALPKNEFVFFEDLPVRVDAVGVGRGDLAAGEIMSVSGSRLMIESSVNTAAAKFVTDGLPVRFDDDSLQIDGAGVISFVAELPGTHGAGENDVYVQVEVTEGETSWAGRNVRVIVPVSGLSSDGEVLAVPATALIATGFGETVVTVVDGDTMRTVVVEPGLSNADGLVEVTPIDGDLSESDWVVVGIER